MHLDFPLSLLTTPAFKLWAKQRPLWVSAGTNGSHFACFDGNGNVMALVAASTGEASAGYEYGLFCEDIRATGPMAKVNRIQFSSQYADDVTGDRKYLYRDYRPGLGRWLSRDPFGHEGGLNLYGFGPGSVPANGQRAWTGVGPGKRTKSMRAGLKP